MTYKIPWSDLDYSTPERFAVDDVLARKWPSKGPKSDEFEKAIEDYLKSDVALVNSGSSAILCALIAHGLKPGDKVVVPDFTYVCTASIPKILGAEIIPCDINPHTYNIDLNELELLCQKHNPKFVISVDIAGLPCDIDALEDLSKRYKFTLIEDAAEAFGAEYKGKKLGSFNHTTIFSFQLTKIISTVEGGCIATPDEAMIRQCKKVADFGRCDKGRYIHDVLGLNLRTTDIQSALGLVQLGKVDQYIARRTQIANAYRFNLAGILEGQLSPDYDAKSSWFMFLAKKLGHKQGDLNRDEFVEHLQFKSIDARTPFEPIHTQPCFPELYNIIPDTFKITGGWQSNFVSWNSLTLPVFNGMTDADVEYVIKSCLED